MKKKKLESINKLSELLRVAIDDLKAVQAMPNYVINMSIWHEPTKHACYVCMAGAVMARTCEMSANSDFGKLKLNDALRKRFNAINQLRAGNVCWAAGMLFNDGYLLTQYSYLNRNIPSYQHQKDLFFEQIEKLHNDLVNAGL